MSEQQRPITVHKRSEQEDCVFCRGALDAEPWRCPRCEVALHVDCADELDRCPSLGCEGDDLETAEVDDAPWRIRDPGFLGVFVANNRRASRLGYTINETRIEGGRGDLLRRLSVVVLPLLLSIAFRFFDLRLLSVLSLVAWVVGILWLLAARPGVETRRRSITILAGPDEWEWIETIDGAETRRLRLPREGEQSFDDSALDRGLIRVGEESFRLPEGPPIQQRVLFYELQRAWLGAEPEGPIPKSLGDDHSNLNRWSGLG